MQNFQKATAILSLSLSQAFGTSSLTEGLHLRPDVKQHRNTERLSTTLNPKPLNPKTLRPIAGLEVCQGLLDRLRAGGEPRVRPL